MPRDPGRRGIPVPVMRQHDRVMTVEIRYRDFSSPVTAHTKSNLRPENGRGMADLFCNVIAKGVRLRPNITTGVSARRNDCSACVHQSSVHLTVIAAAHLVFSLGRAH